MLERHSFIIPIAQLQRKVEMHTSRVGMNRGDESSPHFLERYSLTDGEQFLFEDYLREAVGKVYYWIKAFGKNVDRAYGILPSGASKTVYHEDGVHIKSNGKTYVPGEVLKIDGRGLYSSTVEDDVCTIVFQMPLVKVCVGQSESVTYQVRLVYTTLADGLFEDECEKVETFMVTEDTELAREIEFAVELPNDEFSKELKRVDRVEIEIVSRSIVEREMLHQGDVVEYVFADGSSIVGIQESDGVAVDVRQWLNRSALGSVVMTVEVPEWMDTNMLPAVQVHLEKALENYIMYRWFETVQDDKATFESGRWRKAASLADGFYAKFEAEARLAQVDMNSQRRILQRKSTWLQ